MHDELLDQATNRVPVAGADDTAGSVRLALVGADYDHVDHLVVLAGPKFLGTVPLWALLAAPPETQLKELTDTSPAVVTEGIDQKAVALAVTRAHAYSVVVVDADGDFAGLVPADRIVETLLAEHDEDIARLGGYLASTKRARQAAEENVRRRLWHRLPWLLVGLAGAMASAVIVGAFETQLEEMVLLAVFLPGVVYMADAVGTQTEALVIRGLSIGVSVRQVLARELATGLAIGVAIAAAFFPFALIAWGDSAVALAVSIALLASCSIATVVAMLLPWVLNRLGMDPAFGSGPLATVIQDLLSIGVYFAVAVPIAGP